MSLKLRKISKSAMALIGVCYSIEHSSLEAAQIGFLRSIHPSSINTKLLNVQKDAGKRIVTIQITLPEEEDFSDISDSSDSSFFTEITAGVQHLIEESIEAKNEAKKMEQLQNKMIEDLCESNAKITKLTEDIGCLELRSISLKTDILQKIDEFEKYYRSAHQTIKNFIKENQDLIDCLGIIACRIVLDSSDQIEHLKQFFIEITGLPMTIQNGKKILEESDGEIAYNFKESGGIDDIK